MNFDWTSFVLEFVNFLLLVWLLKRFLYQPVLAVIEQRRVADEQAQLAAQALSAQARSLKAEYEQRLVQADQERARAMAQLAQDMAEERGRRMATLDLVLQSEAQRRQALEASASATRELARERQALALAQRFATRLLAPLATPALEAALIELALRELQNLGAEQRAGLQAALAAGQTPVEVATAFALDGVQQAALTTALSELAGYPVEAVFTQDARLKAGLRINMGAWLMKLNLQDELESLGNQNHHVD